MDPASQKPFDIDESMLGEFGLQARRVPLEDGDRENMPEMFDDDDGSSSSSGSDGGGGADGDGEEDAPVPAPGAETGRGDEPRPPKHMTPTVDLMMGRDNFKARIRSLAEWMGRRHWFPATKVADLASVSVDLDAGTLRYKETAPVKLGRRAASVLRSAVSDQDAHHTEMRDPKPGAQLVACFMTADRPEGGEIVYAIKRTYTKNHGEVKEEDDEVETAVLSAEDTIVLFADLVLRGKFKNHADGKMMNLYDPAMDKAPMGMVPFIMRHPAFCVSCGGHVSTMMQQAPLGEKEFSRHGALGIRMLVPSTVLKLALMCHHAAEYMIKICGREVTASILQSDEYKNMQAILRTSPWEDLAARWLPANFSTSKEAALHLRVLSVAHTSKQPFFDVPVDQLRNCAARVAESLAPAPEEAPAAREPPAVKVVRPPAEAPARSPDTMALDTSAAAAASAKRRKVSAPTQPDPPPADSEQQADEIFRAITRKPKNYLEIAGSSLKPHIDRAVATLRDATLHSGDDRYTIESIDIVKGAVALVKSDGSRSTASPFDPDLYFDANGQRIPLYMALMLRLVSRSNA